MNQTKPHVERITQPMPKHALPPAEAERWGLVVAEPDGAPPRLVPLALHRTVVGAAPSVDLRLRGRFVSRQHAAVRIERGGVTVEDLGSRNGTDVDGQPTELGPAPPGALLRFGDVTATCVRLRPTPPGTLALDTLPCEFGEMVGAAPETLARFHLLNRLAQTSASVLLHGPSGVGKELAARALHERSPRAEGPFVTVNGGALPAALAESELFGARRGAFTGAVADRDGAFLRAHGGTLFLDEVGELPLEVQPKLLRALESGEVQALGAGHPQAVTVRVVAATNRDLWHEVQAGRFRADLLFRLEGVAVAIPGLAARTADTVPIAMALLARLGGSARSLDAAAADWLAEASWPGNVRELRHLLQRATTLGRGPHLGVADLEAARAAGGVSHDRPLQADLRHALDRLIVAKLEERAGDRQAAIRALGIPRSTFYAHLRRLRELGALPRGL